MNKATFEDVVEVFKSTQIPGPFLPNTRLHHDLHIYGDDVVMIFMMLEDRFNVSFRNIDFEKFFFMEEGLPALLKRRQRTSQARPPITIAELAAAIESGEPETFFRKL